MNPRGFLSCEKAERIDRVLPSSEVSPRGYRNLQRLARNLNCDRRLLAASGGGFSQSILGSWWRDHCRYRGKP
jgi:hypothetical protein